MYIGVSYKPFLSLFNMTQAAEMHGELEGIGELTWIRSYANKYV